MKIKIQLGKNGKSMILGYFLVLPNPNLNKDRFIYLTWPVLTWR